MRHIKRHFRHSSKYMITIKNIYIKASVIYRNANTVFKQEKKSPKKFKLRNSSCILYFIFWNQLVLNWSKKTVSSEKRCNITCLQLTLGLTFHLIQFNLLISSVSYMFKAVKILLGIVSHLPFSVCKVIRIC